MDGLESFPKRRKKKPEYENRSGAKKDLSLPSESSSSNSNLQDENQILLLTELRRLPWSLVSGYIAVFLLLLYGMQLALVYSNEMVSVTKVTKLVHLLGMVCNVVAATITVCAAESGKRLSQAELPLSIIDDGLDTLYHKVPRLFRLNSLFLERLLRSVHGFVWRYYLMQLSCAAIMLAIVLSVCPWQRYFSMEDVESAILYLLILLDFIVLPPDVSNPVWKGVCQSFGWRYFALFWTCAIDIVTLASRLGDVISIEVYTYMKALSNVFWMSAALCFIAPMGSVWFEGCSRNGMKNENDPKGGELKRPVSNQRPLSSTYVESRCGRRWPNFFLGKTVQVKERITATLLASASSLKDRVVEELFHVTEMHFLRKSGFEAFSKGTLFLLGEGYEFDKNKLIQLWMAERFLRYERMEILCAKHFEKLVSEGYILCSSKVNPLYTVNSEKVNSYFNTVREKSNYLKLGSKGQPSVVAFGDVLHVSVLGDRNANAKVLSTLKEFRKLRTLLFLGKYGSRLELRDLCLNYGVLIILDLSGTPIKELPSTIGSMPCLRFLDLSWTFIEILPETTENFRGLETLRLTGCSRLVRLPREMRRLIQLRHLDLDVVGQLSFMPRDMGVLVNLRTLPGFIVGTQEGCKITELNGLNSLTGEFRIARLENVLSANEAKKASLEAKSNLRKLELRWTDSQAQEIMSGDDGIIEYLRPHSNLEELRILCYKGANLPAWIADKSFCMLISITLIRCAGISHLPSLSRLPSLESLELFSLNSVAVIDCVLGAGSSVAFPKLKKLIIGEMHGLETWIGEKDGDWPSLVELTIRDCPKLIRVPSLVYLPSIQRVEISCSQQLCFTPRKELSASVELLIIEDCPLISEQCSKWYSRDRCIIKHARNIWIDGEAIQADEERGSQTK